MSNIFEERTAFNFYRSYYDVFLLLPDESKLEFIKALLKAQFEGDIVEPPDAYALFAFRSQMHSIKKQVEGFEKGKKTYPDGNPTKGKDKGKGKQVQEKGEEKEEEEDKEEIYRQFKHLSITQGEFDKLNEDWEKESIDTVLDKIENYAKNKSYTSLYLTALNWLKKDNTAKQKKKLPAFIETNITL